MQSYQKLKENMGEFEQRIGYAFQNKSNLLLALTHSSYANENKNEGLKSNERLEFLGDAVLNIVISETIYQRYSMLAEGEMTKARASIVCETTLVKCANHLEIGHFLLLGKGEELTGGRTRISILSDAFEAVIGAIFIDGGMQHAKSFVLRQLEKLMEDTLKGQNTLDYKTQLQEIVQGRNEGKIVYEIVDENGPDHNKIFVAQVRIGELTAGTG
jgi:ribonuclease III